MLQNYMTLLLPAPDVQLLKVGRTGRVSQWQGSRTENDHGYENFVVPNHKDKQSWPVLTVETVFEESKIVNDYVKAP